MKSWYFFHLQVRISLSPPLFIQYIHRYILNIKINNKIYTDNTLFKHTISFIKRTPHNSQEFNLKCFQEVRNSLIYPIGQPLLWWIPTESNKLSYLYYDNLQVAIQIRSHQHSLEISHLLLSHPYYYLLHDIILNLSDLLCHDIPHPDHHIVPPLLLPLIHICEDWWAHGWLGVGKVETVLSIIQVYIYLWWEAIAKQKKPTKTAWIWEGITPLLTNQIAKNLCSEFSCTGHKQ